MFFRKWFSRWAYVVKAKAQPQQPRVIIEPLEDRRLLSASLYGPGELTYASQWVGAPVYQVWLRIWAARSAQSASLEDTATPSESDVIQPGPFSSMMSFSTSPSDIPDAPEITGFDGQPE